MGIKSYVYLFGEVEADKNLLGGKGAGLAEMTRIGLPVPPGLTITTEACKEYYALNRQFPLGLEEELLSKLHRVEEQVGKKLG
ncbi:MAG: PEP/pyruvate-binding domain-containing protein, partial [Clostridia bacterium]|nr:PEP/pyruvate-binding domain-containing protein [Clostridia bacterium]